MKFFAKLFWNNLGRFHEGYQALKNNDFWRQFQLSETMIKTQNMKINIEFDPGRSQERRKQCAFDFQCVFSHCVVFSFHMVRSTLLPFMIEGAIDVKLTFVTTIWQNVNEGQTKACQSDAKYRKSMQIWIWINNYVWNTLFLIAEEIQCKTKEYLMTFLSNISQKMTPKTLKVFKIFRKTVLKQSGKVPEG